MNVAREVSSIVLPQNTQKQVYSLTLSHPPQILVDKWLNELMNNELMSYSVNELSNKHLVDGEVDEFIR